MRRWQRGPETPRFGTSEVLCDPNRRWLYDLGSRTIESQRGLRSMEVVVRGRVTPNAAQDRVQIQAHSILPPGYEEIIGKESW